MTDLFDRAATRPLIVCDIDGTLAFYQEGAAMAMNVRFGTSYSAESWTTYSGPGNVAERNWVRDECHSSEAFWYCLAPDNQAVAGLRELARLEYSIVIATDRPKKMAPTTVRWLEYWGVPYDSIVVTGPGGKERLAADHGPDNPMVLLDDNPAKWLGIPKPGVEVMCPSRPYTPTGSYPGVTVFDSWDQLVRILEGPPAMSSSELGAAATLPA